jgi:hypothetical protein
VADALNKLAVQFAEANRQEQWSLRRERDEFFRILVAAIRANGGELHLSNLYMDAGSPGDRIESWYDSDNRCWRYRVVNVRLRAAPEPVAERAEGRLPDWML